MADDYVILEDFSDGMGNWWVEGCDDVAVQDGRLVMRADNPDAESGSVSTAWCRTPHPADFVLELDAHVLSSRLDANNINLFLGFSDPSADDLYDSRRSRRSGAYKLYHDLQGTICTFLNDRLGEAEPHPDGSPTARIRIRHCPGFQLLNEAFIGRCRQGKTYQIKVTKRKGLIVYEVDGRELLRATDPSPSDGGLLGLRTFATELWWDNVRLRGLD